MSVNLMSAIFETEFFDIKDEEGNTTKASTAKLVLLAMADHANDHGEGIYPSVERMCKKTALSEQTIRNTLDALKFNGVVFLNGKSKYGTNNHAINTKCFPKSIGNEPVFLTLYPLDPLTVNAEGYKQSLIPPHPLDPNHQLTIKESSTNDKKSIPGVEWAMLSDRKIEKTDFPQALETEALQAFESAFHCPGSWKWYPGKSSDEAAWKSLREAVVKIYQSDGAAGFEGYVTWSAQPYSRGAMTLLAIKNNPENFALSWVAYQGSDAYRAKKTDESRTTYTDSDGIPLT